MRLLAETTRRLWLASALTGTLVAGALGAGQMAQAKDVPEAAPSGPAADYPMVVGAPYQIGTTTFTPADTMNYDIVGHASVLGDVGPGVFAAHHTLPLPSYVEVTALDSGRTILVRVTERGPMHSDHLIALSHDAAAQLGLMAGGSSAVRVRRVNPPEVDRALLRAGQTAPERMATPPALLTVLKRRLGPAETVSLIGAAAKPASAAVAPIAPPAKPKPVPAVTSAPVIAKVVAPKVAVAKVAAPKPAPAKPAPKAAVATKAAAKPVDKKPAAAKPAPSPAPRAQKAAGETGAFVVQAGAFSVKANADAVAAKLGGTVVAAGKLWRVRIGSGTTRTKAEASLAKVKAAGYSGARIQRAQ